MVRRHAQGEEPILSIVTGLGLIVLAVLANGWWWLLGLIGVGLVLYGLFVSMASHRPGRHP
jgi:hypothetical protein